jgi:hypothetical protein
MAKYKTWKLLHVCVIAFTMRYEMLRRPPASARSLICTPTRRRVRVFSMITIITVIYMVDILLKWIFTINWQYYLIGNQYMWCHVRDMPAANSQGIEYVSKVRVTKLNTWNKVIHFG